MFIFFITQTSLFLFIKSLNVATKGNQSKEEKICQYDVLGKKDVSTCRLLKILLYSVLSKIMVGGIGGTNLGWIKIRTLSLNLIFKIENGNEG